MNKLIQKLAEQADIDIRHIEKHADEEFGDHLETFAELIVRECADIADQESRTQCTNIGVEVADRIWHTIRNRFGVK